ncbi:YndJ family protein [Alkalicoccobacillus murimartini]|uniref:YndJ-like protein n=1 Tax=Alkalicoccobacillus murimartini TaxID=171685 RepID=A0ABT9YFW2_9BACI|nr:YndJ family protein [Alkalicoccobacillus murimartini]MDQ0206748.1 hypothetical protein [Alkalicoccobacillus murimartini]
MSRKHVLIGVIAWGIFAFGYPSSIHLLLAFSILVLVPLVFGLTYRQTKPRDWFVRLQPTFSIIGAGSLLFEPGIVSGLLAGSWLGFTMWAAMIGFSRASVRGFRRVEENAIDAAYLYMVVGGLWLVISRTGMDFLPFSDVIVLLTAVHFHYSSLIVPITAGLLGRYIHKKNERIRGYTLLTTLVIIGPLLVGIGISVGGILDISSVIVYSVAFIWLAVESIRIMIRSNDRFLARFLIGMGSTLSIIAMLFSVVYSSGVSFGQSFLSIQQMVRYHGFVQAFGFSLLILIGWSILRPLPMYEYGRFRLSRLRGRFRIGQAFLQETSILRPEQSVRGLIDSFSVFKQEAFDPENVQKEIRLFYEDTNNYEMVAVTKWHGLYKPLSHLYHWVTGHLGQLHLQASQKTPKEQKMDATIYAIDESIDGRHPVRAWIRKDRLTSKDIFIAFYAYYQTNQQIYMDIALPLPFSVMTGILRPQHDESNGLILTSFRKPSLLGDEGVYLTIGKWTFRLPIEEYFHVKATEVKGKLTAVHELHFLGLRCLTIDYEITCKLSKQL